jgi:hypothetical protein
MGTLTLAADTPWMVPVFMNEAIVWDRISTILRQQPTSDQSMSRIIFTTGTTIKSTPETKILMMANNTYQMQAVTTVSANTLVPTSLYLPNRVGLQVSGGLSVSTQMVQMPHDPLTVH